MHYTTSCNTQSSAPEDGRNYRPKHVELIGIINKSLLLHLVDFLYYLKIHVVTLLLMMSPSFLDGSQALVSAYVLSLRDSILLVKRIRLD